jgi:hypothetical protein
MIVLHLSAALIAMLIFFTMVLVTLADCERGKIRARIL